MIEPPMVRITGQRRPDRGTIERSGAHRDYRMSTYDPFDHGFGDALFGLTIIQPEGYTQSGRQHSSRHRSVPLGYAEAKVGSELAPVV